MKISHLFLLGILPFVGIFLSNQSLAQVSVQRDPLILTRDIIPGDFSTEVVDLQNFLLLDADTTIDPPEPGRYGVQTINGIARFQNKYQRTILSPFRRLATGSAEVMTRFKIATIGIKANPDSLRSAEVRSDLRILLSQTINKLDEEIERRANPDAFINENQSDVSLEGETLFFRGQKVPNDVAIGRPGRYEISATEGYFVNDTGEQFFYELPQTTIQPVENPRTFDDLFQNYDYLQQLQGEITYTPLDPGAQSSTVIFGADGTPALKSNSQNTTIPTNPFGVFAPSSSTTTTPGTVSFTNPIILSTQRYSYDLDNPTVLVYGSDFSSTTEAHVYQNGVFFSATTEYISDDEISVRLPGGLTTGRAVIGIENSPYSATEVFVFNDDTCERIGRFGCIDVDLDGVDASSGGQLTFDEEVIIRGDGFDRENNTVETPMGIYHNIPSSDGETIRFTPQYAFVVSDSVEEVEIPFTVRVMNKNGITRFRGVDMILDVQQTYQAQQDRGDDRSGAQSENTLLIEYLDRFDEDPAMVLYEGFVTESRSVVSTTGYDQIVASESQVSFSGEPQGSEYEDKGFLAYLKGMFGQKNNQTFLEAVGFVQPAHALGIPYGGVVTASFPCTCSANWYILVADPRGVAHPVVVQPGYSRVLAYFNVYSPGTRLVGSYTPTTGTCWMYVGFGCSPVPTVGVLSLFPGTGTSAF